MRSGLMGGVLLTLGILAPRAVYLSGFFRKSTTSWSSSLAPSTPCKQ